MLIMKSSNPGMEGSKDDRSRRKDAYLPSQKLNLEGRSIVLKNPLILMEVENEALPSLRVLGAYG